MTEPLNLILKIGIPAFVLIIYFLTSLSKIESKNRMLGTFCFMLILGLVNIFGGFLPDLLFVLYLFILAVFKDHLVPLFLYINGEKIDTTQIKVSEKES